MRKGATTIELQPWSYEDRPRVLIEHSDPDEALELAGALRKAGLTVGICRGPDSDARCPLHQFEPCTAVQGADIVVMALDLETEDGQRVFDGLRTRYPSTPRVLTQAHADPAHVVRAVLAALDS